MLSEPEWFLVRYNHEDRVSWQVKVDERDAMELLGQCTEWDGGADIDGEFRILTTDIYVTRRRC